MTKFRVTVLLRHLGILLLGVAACSNPIEDLPDKNSDSYRMDSAKKAIDEFRFTDAIRQLEGVLRNRPQDDRVKYFLSVAHAGRAGLRVIDLVEEIAEGIENSGIFLIFAQHFTGVSSDDLQDMQKAVRYLEGISSKAAERSNDYNFYAIFLYYAYIGVHLNSVALDPEDSSLRANFRSCHSTVSLDSNKTGISNAAMNEIGSSLVSISDTASAVVVGEDLSVLLDTDLFPDVDDFSICTTQPAHVACLALRTLIGVGATNNGIGLGTPEGVCASVTQ